MKTYLLQSIRFKGDVVFEFNDDGFLVRYDLTGATLTEEQTTFILKRLPKSIEGIKNILAASKDAKLVEQKVTQATFEMFWNKYNEKLKSSKKKCQAWWNRSKQSERDKAYNYLDVYERSIPPGLSKKYAETYLSAELWNN